MVRTWRCRRVKAGVKCDTLNLRTKQKCTTCGGPRPKPRAPAHRAVLEKPYEWWVARFGERCGICGASPSADRRLDRDHDHHGAGDSAARGLLCWSCNLKLDDRIDASWCRRAADYLDRHATREAA